MFKFIKPTSLTLALLLAACGGEADGEAPRTGQQGVSDNGAVCGVPEICHLCADQSCAVGAVDSTDGQCGEVTWTCLDGSDPMSADSATTDDSAAGDGPSSAAECPVPEICHLCPDQTCAEASVEFSDGECGAVTWSCADGSDPASADTFTPDDEPGTNSDPNGTASVENPALDCAIPEICHLCPDGACADAIIDESRGECDLSWLCSDGSPPQ